uniref:Uncharacterized protein n=1 Tax=Cucumis melo TaxID=3656 RepID=A0A9I9E2X6_CUCME
QIARRRRTSPVFFSLPPSSPPPYLSSSPSPSPVTPPSCRSPRSSDAGEPPFVIARFQADPTQNPLPVRAE